MYTFTRQELSRSLMSLYEYSTTPHDTRHGQDPILPNYTTNLVRRTFLYRGPDMWRKLADAVTKVPGSLRALQNVLTRHLHAQWRWYTCQKHIIVVSWVGGGFLGHAYFIFQVFCGMGTSASSIFSIYYNCDYILYIRRCLQIISIGLSKIHLLYMYLLCVYVCLLLLCESEKNIYQYQAPR